jgi:tetratricopeptide (TPR) repeat protein
MGDPYETDLNCFSMLAACLMSGDLERAEAILRRHRRVQELAPSPRVLAGGHIMSGEVHVARGRYEEALASVQEGLALVRGTADMARVLRGQMVVARAQMGLDRYDQALATLEAAARERERHGVMGAELLIYGLLAEAHVEGGLRARIADGGREKRYRGHLDAARASLARAAPLARRFRYGRALQLRMSGVLAWLAGSTARAHASWRQALAWARDNGLPGEQAQTLMWRARMVGSRPEGLESMRADLEEARSLLAGIGAEGEVRQIDRMRR